MLMGPVWVKFLKSIETAHLCSMVFGSLVGRLRACILNSLEILSLRNLAVNVGWEIHFLFLRVSPR